MIEHSRLYEKIFDSKKNFAVMIKHLRAYATGFNGAKELRVMMENVRNSDDVIAKISDFEKQYGIKTVSSVLITSSNAFN